MRVMFIIDSLSGGGAERSTLDYCLYLKDLNHIVKIICLRMDYPGFQEEAVNAGVELHYLGKTGLLSQLETLNKLYESYLPDVVHTTLFKSRVRGRLHKILYRKQHQLIESLVTLSFTGEKVRQRNQNFYKRLAHKLLESALGLSVNHLIAISQEVKSHYVAQYFGINEKKISVIYRGRKPNPYVNQKQSLRRVYAKEIGYSEDALVLIHSGRQDFPKNHLFLLTAFFKLLATESTERPIVLLCLGKKGDMSEKIETLVKQSEKQSEVFFLGHRNDVAQLLAQSDVFIFPSWYEGLGGSIIEAKAAGLPLIVSDIPVFRELLIENTEAFFVDLSDLDDFVSKMKYLVEDGVARNEMGRRNIESFKNRFLIDQVNEQMLNLYRMLLHENSSTGNKETI